MKNIFLLPSTKKTRLSYRGLDGKLLLSSPPDVIFYGSYRNIYITSDENFIRDEYVTDGIEVIKASPKLVDAQGLVGRRDWKKIVLTTDPELIKGGVQSIPNEFLEWFVDNPTCEEVIVEQNYFWEGTFRGYSLRLPKEDLGYTTKIGVEISDEMVRTTMIPKEYFGKEEPKLYTEEEVRSWLIHRDVYLYNYYTTYKNLDIPLQSVDDFIDENHEYLMNREK